MAKTILLIISIIQFLIVLYTFLRVLFENSLTVKLIMMNNSTTNLELAQIRIDRLISRSLIRINDSEFELTTNGRYIFSIFRFLQLLLHKDLSKIEKRIKSSINE